MKSKLFPVQIVYFCQDCNHIVATELVVLEQPLHQTTFQQRHLLVHEVLLDAIQDGIITEEMMKHNLGSWIGTTEDSFKWSTNLPD